MDGTLVELAPTPDAVRVRREMHDVVHALHAAGGGALALVSGRAIADVDRLFPGGVLPVAGQHGLEWRDATGATRGGDVPADALADARARLGAFVSRHDGLLLEDKGSSLALHYRGAPELETHARDEVHAIAQALGEEWAVQPGKCVFEVRPARADKGAAIRAYMAAPPFLGRLPVFVGDDVTDEHGFAVVNALRGHSVKVGDGPSMARWRLRDVDAVERWLGGALTGTMPHETS